MSTKKTALGRGQGLLKAAYLISICAMLIYPFTVLDKGNSAAAHACCDSTDEISIIRDYGWDTEGDADFHGGVDLATASCDKAFAFCGGTVIKIGESDEFGKYAIIDHGDSEGFYGHLTELCVSEGMEIEARDALGTVDGYLHFELRVNGVSVSPHDFLNGVGVVIKQ